MERPAQRGLLAQVAGFGVQRIDGCLAGGDHFARLFEEDVQELLPVVGIGRHGRRCSREGGQLQGGRGRRRGLCDRRGRRRHGLYTRLSAKGSAQVCGRGFCLALGSCGLGRTHAPHEDAQLAELLVIDEELARHGALIAQHVDEKT